MVVVQTLDIGRPHLVWRWICPETGKQRQQSAKTRDRAEAIKGAGRLEAGLRGSPVLLGRTTADWDQCRELYETEHASNLRPSTQSRIATALDHFERIVRPVAMQRITSRQTLDFRQRLRAKGLSEATVSTIIRHAKAFFRWCRDEADLVERIPKFPKGESRSNASKMKGQPITEAEFHRMLKAVKNVRPKDCDRWVRYLRGLWLSGLRLRESIDLSWDGTTPISVRNEDGAWVLSIAGGYQKNGKETTTPIAPDFAELLEQTPVSSRTGRVFPLMNGEGRALNHFWVSEMVIRIASAAKVEREKGRAGAHDFRRAFCSRWSGKVTAAVLQALSRHGSIQTTLTYYVKHNARDISLQLKASAT